ncbi:unnamed protein product, partial [Didymodactylos carnosus]
VIHLTSFESRIQLWYNDPYPPTKIVSRGNIKIAEAEAEFLLDIRNWESLSHDQFRKRLLEIKLFSTEENKSINRWTLPSRGSNLSDNVDESIDQTAHTYEAPMELKQCALVDLRCDNMC